MELNPFMLTITLFWFSTGYFNLEMAMGTRNPNTRWVLPDMKADTGRFLYPRVC
jgi:hypothetical protein